MKSLTPCLWFDDQAEAATKLYTSLFPDCAIGIVNRYTKAGFEHHQKPAGSVMTVAFTLRGETFLALNGGPTFQFNQSMSLYVAEKSPERIRKLWSTLSEGGQVRMELSEYDWCPLYGWVKDRFGVEWQLFLSTQGEEYIAPAFLFTDANFGRGESAIKFYTEQFPGTKVHVLHKAPDGKSVMFADFEIAGRRFSLMEGPGNHSSAFNEAFSLIVNCETQNEIDTFWNGLIQNGGAPSYCGWLKDQFGVSWQVSPALMPEWTLTDDPIRAERVMNVVMSSQKFDLAAIKKAYDG